MPAQQIAEAINYQPPVGLLELADREADGKKLILYGGHVALLDVLKKGSEDSPDELLLRLETSPDRALDLLNHPSLYASPEDAQNVFGDSQPH